MQIVNKIIIHIDGSSQGNPGPSGIGVVFESENKKKLLEISKFIGERTNNQAEYEALVSALKMLKAKHLNWRLTDSPEIIIKTDSELLYYQITGSYKVRDWSLKKLYIEAVKLMKELPKLQLMLIPREENRTCDHLAKKIIKTMIKSGTIAKSKVIKAQNLFS